MDNNFSFLEEISLIMKKEISPALQELLRKADENN